MVRVTWAEVSITRTMVADTASAPTGSLPQSADQQCIARQCNRCLSEGAEIQAGECYPDPTGGDVAIQACRVSLTIGIRGLRPTGVPASRNARHG